MTGPEPRIADPAFADASLALDGGWGDSQPPVFEDVPPALSIEDLHVHFATDAGPVQALHGVSYAVAPGEILAVVGESGSGKSVSVRAVLGMLPENSHREGVIRVGGSDITGLTEKELRALRGAQVAMVFQEPGAALDPLFTVGDQIVETLCAHQKIRAKAARAKAAELLELVRLPDPERMLRRYPHELSGGQKQRVAIALAISCDPKVILADEPTTALDVTVQAEILQLLADLRDRVGTAIVFITHNLGVVANFADRVVVMRSGQIVESGAVRDVFRTPSSEYTRSLLAATPRLDTAPAPRPLWSEAPSLSEWADQGELFEPVPVYQQEAEPEEPESEAEPEHEPEDAGLEEAEHEPHVTPGQVELFEPVPVYQQEAEPEPEHEERRPEQPEPEHEEPQAEHEPELPEPEHEEPQPEEPQTEQPQPEEPQAEHEPEQPEPEHVEPQPEPEPEQPEPEHEEPQPEPEELAPEEAAAEIAATLEAAKSGELGWPAALTRIKKLKAGSRTAAHSVDKPTETQS